MVNDPENPDLAAIAEGIDTDLGDVAGALGQARRAAQYLPADPALVADEASLLAQLGRFDEAERVLRQAATAAKDPDKLAPPFAALYVRMKRFDEGRGYLDRAIAHHPADTKLRIMRGNLARLAADTAAVEREFRAILANDPGNQGALEALVSQLIDRGQIATAEQESLAVAEQQMKNQLNNLRVATVYEARGDEAQAVRFFSAAERSGPATAAVELRIARKLYQLQRRDEMMTHLAEAKRLSIVEEDPESTESIGQLISRMRAEKR
jgi:tetratricopeptide (TPR) repeat protein